MVSIVFYYCLCLSHRIALHFSPRLRVVFHSLPLVASATHPPVCGSSRLPPLHNSQRLQSFSQHVSMASVYGRKRSARWRDLKPATGSGVGLPWIRANRKTRYGLLLWMIIAVCLRVPRHQTPTLTRSMRLYLALVLGLELVLMRMSEQVLILVIMLAVTMIILWVFKCRFPYSR